MEITFLSTDNMYLEKGEGKKKKCKFFSWQCHKNSILKNSSEVAGQDSYMYMQFVAYIFSKCNFVGVLEENFKWGMATLHQREHEKLSAQTKT